MKTRFALSILILAFLLTGCVLTGLAVEEEKMSRDEAELEAFKFLYKNIQNKEVYDQELTVENYVFDSWKEEDVWYVIIYVGHTFIEVRVYDDGSNKIKILPKTDYLNKIPADIKNQMGLL